MANFITSNMNERGTVLSTLLVLTYLILKKSALVQYQFQLHFADE